MSLAPALAAEILRFGGMACYMAGRGAPLLLVHSVNAAASAAEVRPLFEQLQTTRTVFALDLPGFGLSERADRAYTPRLMTDAVAAAGEAVRRHCGVEQVDALAVSLGCEFLARAAAEQPPHWGRLALVSPTGFRGSRELRRAAGSTLELPGLHRIVSARLWGRRLFDGLTRPGVVRYFLERTWGGKAIDEQAWAYAVATAREPGAHHAPLQFLAGRLFSADIHTVYEALTQPVWVSHGVRGDFTDYRGLGRFAGRPNWRISVFQTGALPYFEQPQRFLSELAASLDGTA